MINAARLTRGIRFLLVAFRDFLFPPICPGCGIQEVSAGQLCTQCQERLTSNPPVRRPPAHSNIHHLRALGTYSPPFSLLIQELKYSQRTKLAEVLGSALAQLLMSDAALKQADFLIPVPLHPARLRERGYNQSELLAQQVSLLTGIPVNRALKRIRNTSPQVNKNDKERRKAMNGAFALNGQCALNDRRVILVDDVTTTGATLDAAAEVLKQAGAKRIFALVVASR